MRKANVFMFDRLVGRLIETNEGECQFEYDADYRHISEAEPISPTMPFQDEPYWSDELLLPFKAVHQALPRPDQRHPHPPH